LEDPDQPAMTIDPARWVDDHGDALYGFAMLRLRDADLAAEVVQETFLEALRGRAGFRGDSSERTWLVGILKHKILDQFRSRARRERGVGGDEPGESIEAMFFDEKGGWKAAVPDRFGPPDGALGRAEFWATFRACLAELPKTYADAFTLCELDGLSGAEACKILAITPTNLWARLHRARLLLRRTLGDRGFGRDQGG